MLGDACGSLELLAVTTGDNVESRSKELAMNVGNNVFAIDLMPSMYGFTPLLLLKPY
jgi:hypothetical protein